MDPIFRTVVRTAARFNGTTPETLTGYTRPPGQNVLRTYKSGAPDPVGAFTTQDLGAPDKERAIAVWPRLIGTPNESSRVEVRSAFVGDTPAPYGPNALLLDSQPLTTTYSGPLIVGPTDRVCPVHEEDVEGNCTIEFRSMDLALAVQFGLIDDLSPNPTSDCCSSSSITVTEATTLDPWENNLVVFIDVTNGVAVTLPLLSTLGLGRKVTFVNIGDNYALVAVNVADQMNGVTNGVIELGGNEAVIVERRETTYTGTKPLTGNGEYFNNAVSGATVQISTPDSTIFPVRIEFDAPGFLQLPLLGQASTDQVIEIIRDGGVVQVAIIPRLFEKLNGEVDGRFYLGAGENAVARRTVSGGWLVVGDGAQRPARTLTLAADATLDLWGAGKLNVICTQAAAQTVTLPASTDPIASGAELVIGCAGAGGLTINGNGASIRSGTGAPAGTMALAQHENARLVWADTLWIAVLGT